MMLILAGSAFCLPEQSRFLLQTLLFTSRGGFILKPDAFEFWQGDDNRLHDRVRFRKLKDDEKVDEVLLHSGEGDWVWERLSP